MPIDVDGERPVGHREPGAVPPIHHTRGHDQACQYEPQIGMIGHEVGEIQLGDVDPPLLGQLDEHGDEDRHRHDRQHRQSRRVPAGAHRLVGDEEVLERVREHQQQPPPVQQLEQRDTDEPIDVQEPAHLKRRRLTPVAHRGEVRDRQIEDVERLVIRLVAGQRVVGEGLEDRLVGRIDDQTGEDRGQRETGDRERYEEPRQHDDHKNGGGHSEGERIDRLSGPREMVHNVVIGATRPVSRSKEAAPTIGR